MNLAAALAHKGFRTLLLDIDPSAQITSWLEVVDGFDASKSAVCVMAEGPPISALIQRTRIENLSSVPSAEALED